MRATAYILIFILASSCAKENRWDCFTSYGDRVAERREVGNFESVFLESNIDVEYYYSDHYQVEVIFGDNIIKHIKTENDGGNLKISNETTCNWVRDFDKRPLVKLYAPTLSYMENRCSGDISFKDTLRSTNFTYEQWECNGVANLLVNNELTVVTMHVGFCDVNIEGTTAQAELYSAANGRMRARHLISPVTLSNNTSVQDMELFASDYLYAEINQRGNIKYAGNPAIIESKLNGSGELVDF